MKKILVVEDDSVIRENISDILSEEYSVISAEDGKEAKRILIEDSNFALILSDIMMPNIDGYQLHNYVNSIDTLAEIPFVFLTAKADHNSMRKGMNLGADDYITKPFTIEELLNAVKIRLSKKENFDNKIEELKNNISLYIPHELRTPLVSILGNSELISDYFDDFGKEEILELAKNINKSGKRLQRTIEKFIKYAGFITGDENFVVSDSEILRTVIDESKIKSSLSLCYDCLNRLDDIHFNISLEEIQIESDDFLTLAVELISNACKFSEKGTQIIVDGIVDKNNYIFSVTDSGIGIKKENLKKIDSFVQFDRKRFQQGGNGIGLALVKLICEKYNIDFLIESEVNKFTTARLVFKL